MSKIQYINDPNDLYVSDYICVRYNFKRNKINAILDEMIRWDISIKDLETELDRRAKKQ